MLSVPPVAVAISSTVAGIHTNSFPTSPSCASVITSPLAIFSALGADVPSPQLDVSVSIGLNPAGIVGLFAVASPPFIVLVSWNIPLSSGLPGSSLGGFTTPVPNSSTFPSLSTKYFLPDSSIVTINPSSPLFVPGATLTPSVPKYFSSSCFKKLSFISPPKSSANAAVAANSTFFFFSAISVLAFASLALVSIPFSPVKVAIDTAANINNTIMFSMLSMVRL